MAGGQLAGLLSVAGDRGEGFQLAGLGSVGGEEFTGVQLAGLFGVAGERLKGVQISGLFSVAGASTQGFQASGLFSVAGDCLDGVQLAGLSTWPERTAGPSSSPADEHHRRHLPRTASGSVQRGREVEGSSNRPVQRGRGDRRPSHRAGQSHPQGGPPHPDVRLAGKRDLSQPGSQDLGEKVLFGPLPGGLESSQNIEKCLGYGFQYGYAFPLRASGEAAPGRGSMSTPATSISTTAPFSAGKGSRIVMSFLSGSICLRAFSSGFPGRGNRPRL